MIVVLENCPLDSCPYQGEHSQRITQLEKRVFKLEESTDTNREELHRIDLNSAVMGSNYENIIKTLVKIEGTLDTMQKAIDELKLRPAESWKWIVGIGGGGVLMAVINYVMAIVLKG